MGQMVKKCALKKRRQGQAVLIPKQVYNACTRLWYPQHLVRLANQSSIAENIVVTLIVQCFTSSKATCQGSAQPESPSQENAYAFALISIVHQPATAGELLGHVWPWL